MAFLQSVACRGKLVSIHTSIWFSIFHCLAPCQFLITPKIKHATPTHFNCSPTSHNLWLALCPRSKSKSKCTRRTLIRFQSPFIGFNSILRSFQFACPIDDHRHGAWLVQTWTIFLHSLIQFFFLYEFIGRALKFSAGKSGLPGEHILRCKSLFIFAF